MRAPSKQIDLQFDQMTGPGPEARRRMDSVLGRPWGGGGRGKGRRPIIFFSPRGGGLVLFCLGGAAGNLSRKKNSRLMAPLSLPRPRSLRRDPPADPRSVQRVVRASHVILMSLRGHGPKEFGRKPSVHPLRLPLRSLGGHRAVRGPKRSNRAPIPAGVHRRGTCCDPGHCPEHIEGRIRGEGAGRERKRPALPMHLARRPHDRHPPNIGWAGRR